MTNEEREKRDKETQKWRDSLGICEKCGETKYFAGDLHFPAVDCKAEKEKWEKINQERMAKEKPSSELFASREEQLAYEAMLAEHDRIRFW